MHFSTRIAGSILSSALIFLGARTALGAPLPALELKVAFPELKFVRPLWMEEAPDGSKRLVVAQQDGKVLIVPPSHREQGLKVFLDISERKPWVQNEEGLLAFAFHPQFK